MPRWLVLIVLVTLGALSVPNSALGATRDGVFKGPATAKYVPDEILVTFRDALTPAAARAAFATAHGLQESHFVPDIGLYTFRIVDGESVDGKQRRLAARPEVVRTTKNWLGVPFFIPNDPYYSPEQWSLPKVKMPAAWDTLIAAGKPGGSTRRIAIIDSGVDRNHPDLGSITGWNFADRDNDIDDVFLCRDALGVWYHGHGSMVAGIAAAFTNNAVGIAGANYAAPIMSLRIYSDDDPCSPQIDAAVEAIRHAVNNGASVITASFGFVGLPDEDLQALKDAVTYAYNNNVLVVTASGNNFPQGLSSFDHIVPARWAKALTVGGSTEADLRYRHGNYGEPGLDLVAPAEDLISTNRNGGYQASVQGTSFAVPLVAGVIGLLKAKYPNISSANIKQRLWNAADKVNPGIYNYHWNTICGGQSHMMGCGRLDAAAAVQ